MRNPLGAHQVALLLAGLLASGISAAAPPKAADEYEVQERRGEAAMKEGAFADALEAWRKALAVRPGDINMTCNIGRTEHRRAHYDEAPPWLRRCLDLMPKTRDAYWVELRSKVTLELLTSLNAVSRAAVRALMHATPVT